jgi:hypothetical protein
MGNYFRRVVTTNIDFLGTGRYRDGIGMLTINGKPRVIGGWDGLGGGPGAYLRTFNTQYESTDFFDTVTPLANADWNPRHSFGFGNDSNGDGWVCGSDLQPGADADDRKELWKCDGTTGAWTLVNSNLSNMSNRVLFGFGIDLNTNKKYVFGGQISYTLADGTHGDILEISADGSTVTQVATGLAWLQGNNAGHVTFNPKDGLFHCVCTGGKYDGLEINKTYTKTHYTFDPVSLAVEQLTDFPGNARHYGDLVYHADDENLWFVAGYAKPPSSGALNVAELWYHNGNDWAMIVATTPFTSHATGRLSFANKLLIVMGNESGYAGYMEKYEKT